MIKARHGKTYETALKQGKVDEQMQGLCTHIASTRGYFTSSCCSGRILLLERRGERKLDASFHRKWHRKTSLEELLKGIQESVAGELWMKVDPFILHIGCRDLGGANKILTAMKKAGVKRGGIVLAEKNKFLIELQGTGRMEFMVKKSGKTLVSDTYLKEALATANTLLEKNYSRLEKLGKEFSKLE